MKISNAMTDEERFLEEEKKRGDDYIKELQKREEREYLMSITCHNADFFTRQDALGAYGEYKQELWESVDDEEKFEEKLKTFDEWFNENDN